MSVLSTKRFSLPRLFTVCLFSVVGLSAQAATPQASTLNEQELNTIETLKQSALKSTMSYDLIESLTTEVGARMIGTVQDKMAVEWAKKKFKTLGFDKVWTEPVVYHKWSRGESEARVISPYPQKLVVLALGDSVGTGEQGIQAPIVHFEDLEALKAAKDGSLKGKIAFISKRMTREKDGSGYGPAVSGRSAGPSIASKKGAAAFILRSIGSDSDRVGHTGKLNYQQGVTPIPAGALSNPDADLLVNMLKRNKPIEIFLKLTPKRQLDKPVYSANVIGEITGTEKPEEFVVMGAHLDSWDVGTGAVDDGIGVGITMAAASLIGQLPKRPKRSIRVILFAGEEVGLVGGFQYLEKHKANLHNHIIGVEWDFANGLIYDMRSGVGPSALNAIRDLAKLIAPFGVSLNPANNAPGSSDIRPIVAAGMPAMNFSANGLDYFDFHHTENDTLDKVDKAALPTNTAIYAMFAYFAAQSMVDFRQ